MPQPNHQSRKPAIPAAWIQVAGIMDAAEAQLLLAHGVRWLGFPLRLGYHQPDLAEDAAARLIQSLPDDAVSVLITYQTDAAEIAAFAAFLGVKAVQLHAELPVTEMAQLRALRPDLFFLKSLVVRGSDPVPLLALAQPFVPHVDAFITDTFDPATGACGATGLAHDWAVSRTLAAQLVKPLLLAGGLNPGNVAAAIRAVCPAGVDVHTGIEGADGRKDPAKLTAFLAAAHETVARHHQSA